MRTKDELNEMSMAIGNAINAYHHAIEDNLKECGERPVVDEYDDEESGMRIDIIGRHNDLVNVVVDKVRYNEKNNSVEFHVCEENYSDADYWIYSSEFGDDADYVYECIDWEG